AAEWIGPSQLAELARMFGFGTVSGLELNSEVAGTVPDPAWKERVIGERWFLGNTYHFGIGQGNVLVTPLQVAQMTQAMANHGALCRPHVLNTSSENATVSQVTPDCTELGIAEEHLELVVKGMLDACSPGGTGFPFFEHNNAIRSQLDQATAYREIEAGAVACKTGTAEFGAVDSEGYKSTHAWFTSLFSVPDFENIEIDFSREEQIASDEAIPASESNQYGTVNRLEWLGKVLENKSYPKNIVILVLVESNEGSPYKEGSSDGGPVAKRIFDFIYGNTPTEISPTPEALVE
ncbi:MAG: penicillin-binding transpeptidase domain-containing protein, partial [Microgenomates group bacterium]